MEAMRRRNAQLKLTLSAARAHLHAFETTMETHHAIIGTYCILLTFLFTPVQLALLAVFCGEKRLVYHLMFHSGLMEFVVLLTTLMAGIMSICQSPINVEFSNTAESLLVAGKVGMVVGYFIVALNRLTVVFNVGGSKEKTVFKYIIVFLWVIAIAWFVIIRCFQPRSPVFNLESGLFSYAVYGNPVVNVTLYWIQFGLSLCTCFCYALICFSFMITRLHYTSRFSVNTVEVKILFQAVFTAVIFFVIDHFGCHLTSCRASLNTMYVLGSRSLPIMNTVFYLSIQKAHRRKVLEHLRLAKKVNVIYVVPKQTVTGK